MFWGCFTYEKKGPCHIWEAETLQEKRIRKADLDTRNSAREEEDKRRWELKEKEKYDAFIRKHGRRPGGKRAIWRHTKGNGAYVVKKGRGGIN